MSYRDLSTLNKEFCIQQPTDERKRKSMYFKYQNRIDIRKKIGYSPVDASNHLMPIRCLISTLMQQEIDILLYFLWHPELEYTIHTTAVLYFVYSNDLTGPVMRKQRSHSVACAFAQSDLSLCCSLLR